MEINTFRSVGGEQAGNAVKTSSPKSATTTSGVFAGNPVSVQTTTETMLDCVDDQAINTTEKTRNVRSTRQVPEVTPELSSAIDKADKPFAARADSQEYEEKTLSLPVQITTPTSWMGDPDLESMWTKHLKLQCRSDEIFKLSEQNDKTQKNKEKALLLFLDYVDLRSDYLSYLRKNGGTLKWLKYTFDTKTPEKKDGNSAGSERFCQAIQYDISCGIIRNSVHLVYEWGLCDAILYSITNCLSCDLSVADKKRLQDVNPSAEAAKNLQIMGVLSLYPKSWYQDSSFARLFRQFMKHTNNYTEHLKKQTNYERIKEELRQVIPIRCETMKHTNEYAEYLKKQVDCKRIEEELIRVESVWCDTMFTTLLQKTDTYIFKNLDKNVKESVSYLRDRLYFIGCRSSKLAEADLKTINALLYHCRSFLYKTNDHPTDKMLEALDQLSVRIATVEISKPNTSGGDASTGSTYFGSEYFSYLSSILSVSSWLPFSAPQPKVVHPLPSCWPYYVSILVQLSEVKALWIIPKKEECSDKAIKAEARIDELLQKQQIEGKEWKIFEPHSFKPDKEHEPEVTVERVNANINPYDYDTIDVALTVIPEGMTLIREWKISQSVKISKLSTQFSRNYPKTADQLEGLATKATALSQRRHALKLDFSRESDLTNEDVIQWESDAKVLLDEYDDYLKKNPYQISIIRDMTFKIQSEGKKIFLGNHATLQRIRLFYTDIVRLHANNKKHEIIGLIKQAMEKKDASKTIKVITHRMDYLLDNWIKQQLFSVCHLNIYCNKNNLVENSCRDPIKICLNGIIFFVNLYETVRLLKPTDVTKDSSTMACWHQFESHVKAYLDSGKITEYFDLLRQQLDNDSIWSKSDDYRQAVTLLTPYFCKESVNTVCFDDYLTINFNPQEKPLTDLCVNITMSMAMHSFQYHLDCLKSKKMTVMEWEHSKKNLLAITKFTFDGPLSCYWFHLLYFGSIIKNRTDELVSLIKNNCILSATVSCPEGETTVDQGGDSLPANKASKKAEPSDKLSIYTQLTEVERQKLVESLLEEEGIVSKPQIAHQVKKQSFTAPTAVWRTETENTSDKQQESTDVTKIENQEDLLFSEAEKAICSDPGLAIELLEKINSKATAENNEAVIYRSVLGLAEAAAQLLLPQIAYIPKATKVLKQIEAEMQKALKEQTFEIKYSNYKKLLDYIDLALTRHSDISTGINRYQRYLDSAKYTTQALESETLSTGAVGAIKEKCATCKQYIKQYADYITTLLKCIECRNKALPYLMRNQEQLSDDDPKRRAARKQNAILVKKATQTFTHVLNELKKYK